MHFIIHQNKKYSALQLFPSKLFILVLSLLFLYSVAVIAQDTSKSEIVLRSVADAVLKNATFQFIDQKSGDRILTHEDAPLGAQLKLESPYNDWRYWNGVLNIAMIKLGEVLDEPGYIEFALKNVAFSFDSYKYFESKYQGENKWSYPFGQHFIMEELDDCGAMGSSVIEVFQRDPQDRYRTYVDQAAKHILKKQTRLDDGTFVRSFPHKWTCTVKFFSLFGCKPIISELLIFLL